MSRISKTTRGEEIILAKPCGGKREVQGRDGLWKGSRGEGNSTIVKNTKPLTIWASRGHSPKKGEGIKEFWGPILISQTIVPMKKKRSRRWELAAIFDGRRKNNACSAHLKEVVAMLVREKGVNDVHSLDLRNNQQTLDLGREVSPWEFDQILSGKAPTKKTLQKCREIPVTCKHLLMDVKKERDEGEAILTPPSKKRWGKDPPKVNRRLVRMEKDGEL